MTKLDWTKGPAEPDPGRVVDVGDIGSLSDAEIAAFRKKLAVQRQRGVKKAIGPRVTLTQALRGRKEPQAVGQRIKIVELSGKADADTFIHDTAVLVLRHAQRHSDASQALRLVLAMPHGPRRVRLVNWFHSFSPLALDVKKRRCRFRRPDEKIFRAFDLTRGARMPFNTLAEPLFVTEGRLAKKAGQG